MGNLRVYVHGFQLARLVWPPVVLGDASWLVTWSEQVIHTEFNALFRREETLDEFLVATERVDLLVAHSREVVGPTWNDLNETAQVMCCRQPPHDGCACGDVVRALQQCASPGSRQWRA